MCCPVVLCDELFMRIERRSFLRSSSAVSLGCVLWSVLVNHAGAHNDPGRVLPPTPVPILNLTLHNGRKAHLYEGLSSVKTTRAGEG